MRHFVLTLAYDGTEFHGWQRQPRHRTVQQVLEEAIESITQQRVRVNASGRTDTGVHALAQVVNFGVETGLAPDKVLRAINSQLPEDVLVRSVEEADESFDANRDAKRKLYRYVIHDGAVPDLFHRRYCHHSRCALDAKAMATAARVLRGEHDFACFETEWPNRASSVRTVTHLSVNRFGEWIWIDVEADGFLYNMVRAISGSLINIGRGYWPIDEMGAILESKDRTRAGPTAPAKGLFLVRVVYS